MKITETFLKIEKITKVIKGTIYPGKTTCLKRHSDCFVYILTGTATYTFNQKQVTVNPGDILYLSHNSQYSINVPEPNYTYIFTDFFFNTAETDIFECFAVKSNSLNTDFISLLKNWISTGIANHAKCMSLLYNIYSTVITLSINEYLPSQQIKLITEVTEYIEANLSDSSLSVHTLANLCNLSDGHFRRLFFKVHNYSPNAYITRLRIERAKELLRFSKDTALQIAEKCGFESGYYFSRVFKSKTGFTPIEYRKVIENY